MYKAKTAEEWASMLDPDTLELLPEFNSKKFHRGPYLIQGGSKSARAAKPNPVPVPSRPNQLEFNF